MLVVALMPIVASACDDDLRGSWVADTGVTSLFSLALPDLNLPSGYNFRDRTAIEVESVLGTGQWDVAVDTRGGELVFLPPGALNVESRAGVTAIPGAAFNDVTQAPDSAAFSFDEPVPIVLNTVYVIQTNERTLFGFPCVFFAKLEPFEIDVEAGLVAFLFDVNPFCDDRGLQPDTS